MSTDTDDNELGPILWKAAHRNYNRCDSLLSTPILSYKLLDHWFTWEVI